MTNADVLMIEDEAILAMDMRARLEELGHRVVAVLDRAELAPEGVLRYRPDAVLMDIHTPGSMDGVTAAEAIAKAGPVPIVFVTAYGDPETIMRATSTGPYAYLVKPVDDRELHATMEVVLVKATMWRQLNESHDELARKVNEHSSLNKLFQKQIGEQFDVIDAFRLLSSELRSVHRELSETLDRHHGAEVPLHSPAVDGISLLQRATKLEDVMEIVKGYLSDRSLATEAFHSLFNDLRNAEARMAESVGRAQEVHIPDSGEMLR